jgi:leucyl/phenylalanyl-tRNA---protein transferase
MRLTPDVVRFGYRHGAFPMTMEDGAIEWFRPYRRALFPLSGIRVSRSLRRTIRSGRFEIRFDTAFESVMRGCLRPDDNWISEEFIETYTGIHHEGWAHCSECWLDGQLVGGVYGVCLGACFCAESMFHVATDASKVALWALVERCREVGMEIFDAQVMNPHLASLGAYEIEDREYMVRLAAALAVETPWSRGFFRGRRPH